MRSEQVAVDLDEGRTGRAQRETLQIVMDDRAESPRPWLLASHSRKSQRRRW